MAKPTKHDRRGLADPGEGVEHKTEPFGGRDCWCAPDVAMRCPVCKCDPGRVLSCQACVGRGFIPLVGEPGPEEILVVHR